MTSRLSYSGPAAKWTEALPIGSGLIGAMCFGGAGNELFQLNHTSGWSGGPATELSGDVPSASVAQAAIESSRRLIAERDFVGADRALGAVQHRYPQSFLPFANVVLCISADGEKVAERGGDHVRELDLATAVHTTRYRLGDREIRTTARASHPDDVMVITVDVEGPGGVDLDVSLTSPLTTLHRDDHADGTDVLVRFPSDVLSNKQDDPEPVRYSEGEQVALEGAAVLRWRHDGSPGATHPAIGVRHAEIVIALETTFTALGAPLRGDAQSARAAAVGRVDAALRDVAGVSARQEQDHAALFERSRLELGGTDERPTDLRLRDAFDAPAGALEADPGLAALLFNYGRYLLICSSREGGLPANLQGIWNDLMQPPWSSDYTTNINLEMNYWLAEHTDLVECLPPLFDYIEALAERGTETASRVFGLPGWAAFHCSDAWAYSQSVGDGTHDPSWAFWPFAGPWLLQHFRERLMHGGGDDVAERAWPVTQSAAQFLLGFLIEEPDGTLGTSPSTSPENHFTTPDGTRGATASSATMDISLTRALFRFVAELAERLGRTDDEIARAAADALPRLPAPPIGPDGLVQEWRDPSLVPDGNHRHTAHLYFLHPGDEEVDAELATAADASLTARGDESTGWSLAWKTAMRARLHQPERADALLRLLFRDASVDRGPFAGGLYPNLFAAHPPFQIDANLGFVTAIAECLVQSHTGVIELLPALPAVLGPGSVHGLIARPGVEIELSWNGQGLTRATLTARAAAAGTHRIRLGDRTVLRELEPGVPVELTPADFATHSAQPARPARRHSTPMIELRKATT